MSSANTSLAQAVERLAVVRARAGQPHWSQDESVTSSKNVPWLALGPPLVLGQGEPCWSCSTPGGIWILGFNEFCWVGCLPQFHGLALNPNRRLRFNKRLTRWVPNLDTDSSAANALASGLPAWTEVEVTYLYISKDKNNHYT